MKGQPGLSAHADGHLNGHPFAASFRTFRIRFARVWSLGETRYGRIAKVWSPCPALDRGGTVRPAPCTSHAGTVLAAGIDHGLIHLPTQTRKTVAPVLPAQGNWIILRDQIQGQQPGIQRPFSRHNSHLPSESQSQHASGLPWQSTWADSVVPLPRKSVSLLAMPIA